jgi:hypothetical protein
MKWIIRSRNPRINSWWYWVGKDWGYLDAKHAVRYPTKEEATRKAVMLRFDPVLIDDIVMDVHAVKS